MFPPILFNDVSLKATQYKKQLIRKIELVISSGTYLHGKENNDLEKTLSTLFLNRFITTVGSGHDAVALALSALHLQPTDEIIFPVNAYPTAFPVFLSGATPVPIDVDLNGQLSLDAVKKRITSKTKVIILVHLYGLTTNIKAFQSLAKQNNIILIEDCAQAFGTRFHDMQVGTFGDIACFSFYPTKNLGTLGDGGALVTNKKNLFNHFLKNRSYGEKARYMSLFPSGHSRLPEIQAGILNLYIQHSEEEYTKRKRIADYYDKGLKHLDNFVTTLASHKHSSPNLHLFVIRAKKRDKLISFLNKKGIPTHIHYPLPIHLIPAFSSLGHKKGMFPIAETLALEIVSLPFHPHLSKLQINYIITSMGKFYLSQ